MAACIWALAILFSCEGGKTEIDATYLRITQGGSSLTELPFAPTGGNAVIQVVSDVDWEVGCDQDWCTLSNVSGQAGLTVNLKVTVDAYAGETQRTAVLSFTAGSLSAKVTVKQTGISSRDETGAETAMAAVRGMRAGKNLFNTLDCTGDWIHEWTEDKPSDYETAWGNPVVTRAQIHAFKEAGFTAIRVPVTWYPHMDENWVVKEDWMARVEEVVGYVLDEGMYCILNVHHDTGADSESAWLNAELANIGPITEKYTALWQQIATRFNHFGEKLLFESLNEIIQFKYGWNDPKNDNTPYEAVNRLNQSFVNTVRATGGNNERRNLIVNTYRADPGKQTITAFQLPEDSVDSHLAVEVHVYIPGDFIMGESKAVWTDASATQVENAFKVLADRFVTAGIPVVVGEWGGDQDHAASEGDLVQLADCYMAQAAKYGFATFWWACLMDRKEMKWILPNVRDAIISGSKN